jgi:hypothetical protein
MSSIIGQLSKTVVFLFDESGQTPIGTGFLIGYPVEGKPNLSIPLIATAKHVIGGRERIVARYTPKANPTPVSIPYNLAELRRNGDLWEHQDKGVDIVLFRTTHFDVTDYLTIPPSLIASRQKFSDEDIKASDRIIFPCLLVNFMGASRNFPVVRDGSIALIPEEDVPIEYNVGTEHISTRQQLIFIDATAIPGASGSPVFLHPSPRLKNNNLALEGTVFLLGIMHGFYQAVPRPIEEIRVTSSVNVFRENSGIALVFPSWRILEILESQPLTQRLRSLMTT